MSSVSPGFAMHIMLILFSLCYHGSLVTLKYFFGERGREERERER
jgi:hypothetical protein